jgi:hypothetical protein
MRYRGEREGGVIIVQITDQFKIVQRYRRGQGRQQE